MSPEFAAVPSKFCRISNARADMLVKMTTSDLDLLKEYAGPNSEEAFATLVKRHLNLVYSAALRQVRSPQLAEEITQSVFSDLAQNAHKLRSGTILTAWLYQVTRAHRSRHFRLDRCWSIPRTLHHDARYNERK